MFIRIYKLNYRYELTKKFLYYIDHVRILYLLRWCIELKIISIKIKRSETPSKLILIILI